MSTPTQDQKEAGLMQMKINTRLTALQTALELMKTHGYTGIPGEKKNELGDTVPAWVTKPGGVDHITLLAMASDIESYIIGDLVEEAVKAIEAAKEAMKNPRPHIIRGRP